ANARKAHTRECGTTKRATASKAVRA
ncbi:tonB-like domain protein, partial [Vibrio parahaemolyticus V-223/04]